MQFDGDAGPVVRAAAGAPLVFRFTFQPTEVLISSLPDTRFGFMRKDLIEWAKDRFEPEVTVTHIPVRVEDDGLGSTQALDLAIRADPQNLVAANGDRFLEVGAATRVHLAIDDDEVDGAAGVIALCADNKAGDERRADDDADKNGGKSRRHFR